MADIVGEEQAGAVENRETTGFFSGLSESAKLGLCVMSLVVLISSGILVLNMYYPLLGDDGANYAQVNLNTYSGSLVYISEFVKLYPTSYFDFFRLPDRTMTSPPDTVIQHEAPVPGKCWAFHGQGNLIMRLGTPALVYGVYMEHISKNEDPTGDINSAPRHFRVYGMNESSVWVKLIGLFWGSPKDRTLLGEFEFLKTGRPKQYFPINSNSIWELIEVEVLDNYGAKLTCLYKFRVQGRFPSCHN